MLIFITFYSWGYRAKKIRTLIKNDASTQVISIHKCRQWYHISSGKIP
jgi:hypothetical protein